MDQNHGLQHKKPISLWKIVAKRELYDQWIGGKIPVLLILYSIVLSSMSFLLATNSELSLIPPKEMVFMEVNISLAVSLLICLILSANSISGERESGTLESHLLSPISRRQLILAKFIAGFSPWPVIFFISSVYISILSPTFQFTLFSLFWYAVIGSLLVLIIVSFGLIISIDSNSNKMSLSISLMVLILLLIPTQLPGTAQTGSVGLFFKRINPVESSLHLLEKLFVNNATISQMSTWFLAPIIAAILLLLFLFIYKFAHLHLKGEFKLFSKRTIHSSILILLLLGSIHPLSTNAEGNKTIDQKLQISVDKSYKVAQTGENFQFQTSILNNGSDKTGPLVMAMNIINLDDGATVDPEDWSPKRSQILKNIASGDSKKLSWTVQPILKGDYMVYMAAIPKPGEMKSSSEPVAVSAIHLTVKQHTRLNPGGILPVAIGMPLILLMVWIILRVKRRREVN